MTHDIPMSDARLIWQSQRREYAVMSVDEVRAMAQLVQARVRRNLVIAIALGVLLLVLCAMTVAGASSTPVRLITAAMIVVTLAIAYTSYKRFWPYERLSPQAALKTSVDFYRGELHAQYRSAALSWKFLVPTVVFAFMSWNAFFRTSPLIPRILFSAVLALLLFFRRHEVRKLRRNLAALDAFEKENSFQA